MLEAHLDSWHKIELEGANCGQEKGQMVENELKNAKPGLQHLLIKLFLNFLSCHGSSRRRRLLVTTAAALLPSILIGGLCDALQSP